MKKIIVTGASGFIGRSLVKKLSLNKKNIVYALDNDLRGSLMKINSSQNIVKKKIDILNYKKLEKIFKNCHSCFHLAALNGTKNFYDFPKKVLEVGIQGTINVLNLCIKNKVKKFIYFSSSEAYQKPKHIPTTENEVLKIPDIFNPRFSYGGSKLIGELLTVNYFRETKVHYNIIRPHNVYGPDMGVDHAIPQLIKKISKKKNKKKIKLKILGSGNETRSYIYIDDAINGILKIYRKGKKNSVYNLGTLNEISIKKIVQKLSKILKINITIIKGNLFKGSVLRRCPDIKKLKQLGFKINFSIDYGLKKMLAFYF